METLREGGTVMEHSVVDLLPGIQCECLRDRVVGIAGIVLPHDVDLDLAVPMVAVRLQTHVGQGDFDLRAVSVRSQVSRECAVQMRCASNGLQVAIRNSFSRCFGSFFAPSGSK